MEGQVQVSWSREERTLTLEGEPVLTYALSWPAVENAGLGGRWISCYYARLAGSWRRRWTGPFPIRHRQGCCCGPWW